MAEEKVQAPTLESLGLGLFISSSMFVLGSLLGNFIPMHPFALMILAVAVIKVSGLLPRRYEQAAADWYQFVVSNLTPPCWWGSVSPTPAFPSSSAPSPSATSCWYW